MIPTGRESACGASTQSDSWQLQTWQPTTYMFGTTMPNRHLFCKESRELAPQHRLVSGAWRTSFRAGSAHETVTMADNENDVEMVDDKKASAEAPQEGEAPTLEGGSTQALEAEPGSNGAAEEKVRLPETC